MSIKRKRQAGEAGERLNPRKTHHSPSDGPTPTHAAVGTAASGADTSNRVSGPPSPSSREEPSTEQNSIDSSDKLSAKEKKEEKKRRKAERKAAKALLSADKVDGEITSTNPTIEASLPENGKAESSEISSKAERKAKKRKLKEAKAVPAQSNGAANSQSNGAESSTSSASFLDVNSIAFNDHSRSTACVPMDTFAKLPHRAAEIMQPFLRFEKPTPIQAASWHAALNGRDVVGVAETGSGKTLAFGVPLINHVLSKKTGKRPGVSALVVSPTRELAVQIQDQISVLAKPYELHSACIYGGVPKDPQREELKRASIIVATPGRLNDLLDEGCASLASATYVVLDEADRMLDKGFEDAIRKIVSSTPTSGRQTLMFTATWPPSVRELASTFMHEPVHITIGSEPESLRANTRIAQTVEVVSPMQKEARLLELLREHQTGRNRDARILVFCLYKKEAARVETLLRRRGHRVAGIHGDLSQERRSASLEAFRSGTTPLLVATDVAARGLDIPDVRLVLNVTFPLTAEDYVHRIGRTGRAGADGRAITLFTEHDKPLAGALINVLKAAGQPVPDDLLKFGTTVKKKAHDSYGAFYRAPADGAKKATKITFDD